jgi:hypothetical protein
MLGNRLIKEVGMADYGQGLTVSEAEYLARMHAQEMHARQNIALGALGGTSVNEESLREGLTRQAEYAMHQVRERALLTAIELVKGTPLAADCDAVTKVARAFLAFIKDG